MHGLKIGLYLNYLHLYLLWSLLSLAVVFCFMDHHDSFTQSPTDGHLDWSQPFRFYQKKKKKWSDDYPACSCSSVSVGLFQRVEWLVTNDFPY